MSDALIIVDAAGYPNRMEGLRRAMADAGVRFLCVAPPDKPQPHALEVDIPPEWLPQNDLSLGRRQWWCNHLQFLDAVRRYNVTEDRVWCAESDVQAEPATWLKAFLLTKDSPQDGLFTRLWHRDQVPGNHWFTVPGTPDWGVWYCLGALYRLTLRVFDWIEECAAATRGSFVEVILPSLIVHNGGTVDRINQSHDTRISLYNSATMRFPPKTPRPSRGMFAHPCKWDEQPAT